MLLRGGVSLVDTAFQTSECLAKRASDNHHSIVFSKRSQLSPAIPQVHMECYIRTDANLAPANLQKCVGGFLLYKFWRIFPGIFLEDFSGHFFPQK